MKQEKELKGTVSITFRPDDRIRLQVWADADHLTVTAFCRRVILEKLDELDSEYEEDGDASIKGVTRGRRAEMVA